MKYILCLLLLGISVLGTAHADEDGLPPAVLTGFESKHGDNRDDLNSHNPGVGFRFQDGWTVGTYYNSIRRHSVYAGREWQYKLLGGDAKSLSIGAVGGAVTGYFGGVHLLVVPELIAQYQHVEAAIILIPRVTKTPLTLALQLRWRI